jgi:SecD/SecF fusion protein
MDKSGKKAVGATLTFIDEKGGPGYASVPQVQRLIASSLEAHGLPRTSFSVDPPADRGKESEENPGHYTELRLSLSDPLERSQLEPVLQAVQQQLKDMPQPERLEIFDSQLAASTQQRALYAILASWAAILLYLWFRFGSWTFGAAAVICLIHDLFFTLGVIAACHYLHEWMPGLAHVVGVQDFKIDLPAVAALLTLVGYSVNDTIVVFDRIREVRGKNPALTPQMINDSVNQTLTRTLLASTTVFLVVLVLYVAGGEGVKLFAFVMIVGVVVGTYSSIYIASPLLLIFGEGQVSAAQLDRAPAAQGGASSTGIKRG